MRMKLVLASLLIFTACTSATLQPQRSAYPQTAQTPMQIAANPTSISSASLTLNQIMADQDWVARSPESAYWMVDGSGVLYAQKRLGSELRDWFHLPLSGDQASDLRSHAVPLDRLHQYAYRDGVYSQDRRLLAYTFEGNVFVREISSGQVQQLTRDTARQSQLKFLTDGRLSYRQANDFYTVDPHTGLTRQLAVLMTQDAPEVPGELKDFIAREQVDLIEFLQQERSARVARDAQQQALQQANNSLAPSPFYLGKDKRIVAASLSPAADKMLVAVTAQQETRSASDIMGNYAKPMSPGNRHALLP